MAISNRGTNLPGQVAAADLSGVTGGRFLTMGATGLDLTAAAGRIDAVLEHDSAPGLGQAVTAMGPGSVAKVEASAAITQGDSVGSAANGQARTAAANDFIAGVALNDVGAAGEIVSVFITTPGIQP